jgi:hypothetical protein
MPQRMVRLDGGRGEPTSQPPTLPTKPREPQAWHPRLGDILRTSLEDETGSEHVAAHQPLCASPPDRRRFPEVVRAGILIHLTARRLTQKRQKRGEHDTLLAVQESWHRKRRSHVQVAGHYHHK